MRAGIFLDHSVQPFLGFRGMVFAEIGKSDLELGAGDFVTLGVILDDRGIRFDGFVEFFLAE